MPVMDGVEAVVKIREFEKMHPHCPPSCIIALTADAMSGDRKKCMDAGMNEYLSKPIRRPELANALDKAVQSLSFERKT